MIRTCTDFFRAHGVPCCGNNYCRYLYDDSISCAIKPSRAESWKLRKEGVEG